MILCKDRVVREQMMPNRQSTRMARRTVWRGELFAGVSKASRWGDYSLRGWRIRLERVRALGKVGVHDYSCKDHLRNGISETGHAGGLTKEITPPNDPRPDGDVLLGNDMLGYEIHAASRWIGRHQFRDCQASVGGMFCIGGNAIQDAHMQERTGTGDAHSHDRAYEPRPNSGGGPSRGEWGANGGRNGAQNAQDRDSIRHGRPFVELATQLLFVANAREQPLVVIMDRGHCGPVRCCSCRCFLF